MFIIRMSAFGGRWVDMDTAKDSKQALNKLSYLSKKAKHAEGFIYQIENEKEGICLEFRNEKGRLVMT